MANDSVQKLLKNTHVPTLLPLYIPKYLSNVARADCDDYFLKIASRTAATNSSW